MKKISRFLMINCIKFIPFIILVFQILGVFEFLCSYTNDIYIEYQNENGEILKIVYETQFYDSLKSLVGVSYITLAFMLICSFALEFCLWHRIPMYFLLLNLIASTTFLDYTLVSGVLTYSITFIALAILTIIISVYLHQKDVRRKRKLADTPASH